MPAAHRPLTDVYGPADSYTQGCPASAVTSIYSGAKGKGVRHANHAQPHHYGALDCPDRFLSCHNTHDVSGVLECFSEEAVVTIVCPKQQTSVVYQGKAHIQAFVE